MLAKWFMGNWKMNNSIADIEGFYGSVASCVDRTQGDANVVIFPPFTMLTKAGELASDKQTERFRFGAQNVSEFSKGSYTGQVSAAHLADVGMRYCLVGHSECRQYLAETETQINSKISGLIKNNIMPVLCVGESLQDYETGNTENVICAQLDGALTGNSMQTCFVAYEPIWSIGTGKIADAKYANNVAKLIKTHLKKQYKKVVVLYGGSVNAQNVNGFNACKSIDGFLIGGASLEANNFCSIIENYYKKSK